MGDDGRGGFFVACGCLRLFEYSRVIFFLGCLFCGVVVVCFVVFLRLWRGCGAVERSCGGEEG